MTDAKKPAPGQDVYPGDEVFFDHRAGPLSGRVLAYGRHGCTVDVAGKRHKVEWGRVLGHKKRAKLDVRVLDHGEDGMVVEDASGRRRFIGVAPAEAPQRIPANPRHTVKPARSEEHTSELQSLMRNS